MKTARNIMMILVVISALAGCSDVPCGTFDETDIGQVVGYAHLKGITNVKTDTHTVDLQGTIPVKIGASAVLRVWAHPSAPGVDTVYFPDYGTEYLVVGP